MVHACHPGVVSSKVAAGVMGGSGDATWAEAKACAVAPVFLALDDAAGVLEGSGRWWNLL